jgi:retron-type reverse transcriptase
VLDIDVKGYFDSIDWELLLKAVRHHTTCAWVRLYIERWLKAPVQMEDGSVVPRTARTPQGGVISPLRQVLAAIRDDELYVFTHLETREPVEERFRTILAAFDEAAAIPDHGGSGG